MKENFGSDRDGVWRLLGYNDILTNLLLVRIVIYKNYFIHFNEEKNVEIKSERRKKG